MVVVKHGRNAFVKLFLIVACVPESGGETCPLRTSAATQVVKRNRHFLLFSESHPQIRQITYVDCVTPQMLSADRSGTPLGGTPHGFPQRR
jgi:hypothetical protein